MGFDAKTGFSGIVTATAEVTGDATGLRVADNVTLRKEGALTLRSTFGSSALSRAYKAAFPYRGVLYYIAGSNVIYDSTQAAMTYNNSTPGAIRDDVQSAKEARGNLYFASSSGVWKTTGVGAALTRTGVWPGNAASAGTSLTATGTPLILPTASQVAYRLVAKRTDANGVILRSRPSGAQVVSNASGASAAPTVLIACLSTDPPDEVEIYRTRVFPTSSQVDDEMQLVGTVKISQFAAGSPRLYTFVDRVADTARGTTLYTSPSRGGIEAANDRPPAAACIERFRTSLFFGNVRGPQRTTFSWKFSGDPNGIVTGSATGIGRRIYTGNTTNGNATIASMSSTVGVQIGQVVQGGSVNGRVTGVTANTVTVSPAPSATATGVSLTFTDGILYSYYGNAANLFGATVQAAAGQSSTSYSLAQNGVTAAYEVTPALPGYDVTLVFESIERGNSANVSMTATHGDEFNPPLPLPTATPLTLPVESIAHGLAWSEPDEPEHAPPKNFARVGDSGKDVLALIATKDRLLIFKEDGLFMLTGDTAKNFGIYPLDTTCLCILPGSVRRLQNTVYALTNLGLVAVDEGGGVTVVSRSIQTELAPIVTQIRQAQASSGLYLMPGLSGVTGTSDDPNGEYWLMLGTTTPSFGGQMLVWNAFRRGFTTFNFGTPTPVCVAQDGSGQPLVLTASTLLTPSTSLGVIVARVSPRAFSDPALVGKFWSHIVAGFSQLTGTTNVQAKFAASESMVAGASVTEPFDLPLDAGTSLLQFPLGSLLRHPVPSAFRRAYMLVIELTLNVTSGTFTLETIAAESRQNISNKEPLHGSGAS